MGGNKSPLVPSPTPVAGKKPPPKTAVVPVAIVYNVYLVNALAIVPDQALSASNESAIISTIQGYFNQIIAARRSIKGTQFSSALVQWIPPAGPYPTIAAYELLVYLLPWGKSIITTRTLTTVATPTDHYGLSQTGSADGRNASEAYISSTSTTNNADIVFHEMMHNKQNMDNSMHTQDGLAAASFLFGSGLSQGNIQNMAAALPNNRHPQWTGGLAILASELTRNPYDPIRGIE